MHRVKSELHTRWESNQDLVSSIRDRLAQHSSQLMDLRDALNEAVNKTRQTEDLNSLNRNNLEENQVDPPPGGPIVPCSEGAYPSLTDTQPCVCVFSTRAVNSKSSMRWCRRP